MGVVVVVLVGRRGWSQGAPTAVVWTGGQAVVVLLPDVVDVVEVGVGGVSQAVRHHVVAVVVFVAVICVVSVVVLRFDLIVFRAVVIVFLWPDCLCLHHGVAGLTVWS